MNCPSRTEEPEGTGFNQNPSSLSADLTTRQDLNGIANSRVLRRIPSEIQDGVILNSVPPDDEKLKGEREKGGVAKGTEVGESHVGSERGGISAGGSVVGDGGNGGEGGSWLLRYFLKLRKFLITYAKFVGPGFMVSPLIFSTCLHSLTFAITDLSGIH
jgi:metal iron transporter